MIDSISQDQLNLFICIIIEHYSKDTSGNNSSGFFTWEQARAAYYNYFDRKPHKELKDNQIQDDLTDLFNTGLIKRTGKVRKSLEYLFLSDFP